MKKTKDASMHIRLPRELRNKLKLEAAKRDITLSSVIELALKQLK